jgi:hypothetical protein
LSRGRSIFAGTVEAISASRVPAFSRRNFTELDLLRGSHGGPFRDPQFLLIADI